jgi:RNA polymerase sigma-70 factor (ECF subfamily)
MEVADAAPSFAELVGNEARFRVWYDEALPRVYRYLLARCGDQSVAEEVTQEAFIEAVRHRRGFEGRSDPVSWICAIGRNRLADHVRRDHRDRARHLRLINVQSDQDPRAWRQSDVREDVERALATLTPEHRLALILCYLDGMRVREVAGLLHRSESATESLLTRAREAFRRAYQGTDR